MANVTFFIQADSKEAIRDTSRLMEEISALYERETMLTFQRDLLLLLSTILVVVIAAVL